MKVYVIALDGVFDTGLATVLDTFGTANELAELFGLTLAFRSEDGRSAQDGSDFPRTNRAGPFCSRSDLSRFSDCAALGYKMPEPLIAALARPDVNDAGHAIRRWADRALTIAAACIGTFVLAESALLDGHDATTTWWLAPLFRQRYPKVRLDESRIIIPSPGLRKPISEKWSGRQIQVRFKIKPGTRAPR